MASRIASSSRTPSPALIIPTPSSSTTFLPVPEAAFVAPESRTRPQDPASDTPYTTTSNMIDDFFGAPRVTRGTVESRHDAPPPYSRFSFAGSTAELPTYGEHTAHSKEPPTLAMYLFKYGFVFPFFWLAGIFILFSTLSAPEDWETGKSEQERAELLQHLGTIERKWAKRCAWAFSIFAFLATALVVTIVSVVRFS